MSDPSFLVRAGQAGALLRGTPGNVLGFDGNGELVSGRPPRAALPFINVKDNEVANLKGDGSDETAAVRRLFAFAATFAAGVTLYWPIGVYGVSGTLDYPENSVFIGESQVGSELKLLAGSPPVDLLRMPSVLQQGGLGVASLVTMLFTNDTTRNGAVPAWAPGTNYAAGSYVHPRSASPILLKCITPGISGAHEPIGALTPVLSRTKLVGTANASCQPVFKVVTPGRLGVMRFVLSTDGGGVFGAPVQTVAGESFFYPIPGFGGSYGIVFADFPYGLPLALTISAGFNQPAVGANVNVAFTSIVGVSQVDMLLCSGGLYLVVGFPGGNSLTLRNLGTAAAAIPGAAVAAGAANIVVPPNAKVEVLGTPAVDSQIVDIVTQGGPLGSAAATFAYGQGSVPGTNKWKEGITVGQSGLQATVAGAFYDFPIPATPLTLRIHTGIVSNTGSYSYLTPAAQWSLQVGSTVTDNTAVWEVVQGPAVIRNAPVGFSATDAYIRGGSFGLVMREGISSVLDGSGIITDTLYANVWYPNGDSTYGEQRGSTNANTIEGAWQFYGPTYGIVHDGGFGFTCSGVNFQATNTGFMFLAGLAGCDIGGNYLEAPGGLMMNCAEASRVPVGVVIAPSVHGNYFGSAQSASTFELYLVESPAFVGNLLGGTTFGLTGVNTCRGNVFVKGNTQLHGKPVIDSLPPSGDVAGLGVSGNMAFQFNNNFAGNGFMSTAPLAGRYRVSAYLAVLTPATAAAPAVKVTYTDLTGVIKTVTLFTIADASIAGSGAGGEAIIQCNGATGTTMSMTGVVTPGALSFDFSASLVPDIA